MKTVIVAMILALVGCSNDSEQSESKLVEIEVDASSQLDVWYQVDGSPHKMAVDPTSTTSWIVNANDERIGDDVEVLMMLNHQNTNYCWFAKVLDNEYPFIAFGGDGQVAEARDGITVCGSRKTCDSIGLNGGNSASNGQLTGAFSQSSCD